jgi:hypothetical protein
VSQPAEAALSTLAGLVECARLGPDPLREARRAFCRRWLAEQLRRLQAAEAEVPRSLLDWALEEAESVTSGIPLEPLAEVERELRLLATELAERMRDRG